jgi:hypothetical protein
MIERFFRFLDWLQQKFTAPCLLCHRDYPVWAGCEHGYTIAGIIAVVVAAAAAGASAYMASEAQADAAREQKKMARRQAEVADWQKKAEEQQAEAARKQARLRASRILNSQASKAGAAGVVASEGSLLTNQMEAASLAQYDEDLAAYSHRLNAAGAEITADTHRYESRIFGARAANIKANQWLNVGISAAGAGASAYTSSGMGRSGGGGTVATQTQQTGTQDTYGNLA